jgi:xylulokinase
MSALTRAVMEGVAFALRDSLEALRAAGSELQRVTAVGGGSRARSWLKVIAKALNLPVDLPAEGDCGAAFGAARLGMIAATGAPPTEVCAPPPIAATIGPDSALRDPFEKMYRQYRTVYPAISAVIGNK